LFKNTSTVLELADQFSYGCKQFGNEFLIAHTDLSAAFFLLHTAVGDCDMKKFGTFWQAPGRLGAVGTGSGVETR